MKNTKIKFDEYFSQIYQERWPELKEKLLEHHFQVARPTFQNSLKTKISEKEILEYEKYDESIKGIQFKTNEAGLKTHYIMDPASIICANSLDIEGSDHILDMCAAPGGKTLILLEKLESGTLWANEISKNRREKLKRVIQEYAPSEFREKIFLKGKDGLKYGLMFPDTFDKILVDAPCSGEKHLLNSPKELEKWSIKRTKRLSGIQYGLLCSALLACKEDGLITYSTCSISPLENDEIIKKILHKKADQVELDLPDIKIPGIEKTDFGYILLPDKSGFGPIYFSRLKKSITKDS